MATVIEAYVGDWPVEQVNYAIGRVGDLLACLPDGNNVVVGSREAGPDDYDQSWE